MVDCGWLSYIPDSDRCGFLFLYGVDVIPLSKEKELMSCSDEPCVDRREGNARKKILLTGTCWFELTGLLYLLSSQEFDIYRVPQGYRCAPDCWDLIIVALSTEPVVGWGRYITWIRELREQMSGKMLVLVPQRLKSLRILHNVCPVFSGEVNLPVLRSYIHTVLNNRKVPSGKFRVTEGQRQALTRLSTKGRDVPLDLQGSERRLYWHYAHLAKNVGVRDFRMLLMTGLDRVLD